MLTVRQTLVCLPVVQRLPMQTLHISEEHGAANRKIFRECRLLTVRVCRAGYIYEVESVIVLPTQEAIVCGRATRREIYFSWFLQSKHFIFGLWHFELWRWHFPYTHSFYFGLGYCFWQISTCAGHFLQNQTWNIIITNLGTMAQWLCHRLMGWLGSGFASRYRLHTRAGF